MFIFPWTTIVPTYILHQLTSHPPIKLYYFFILKNYRIFFALSFFFLCVAVFYCFQQFLQISEYSLCLLVPYLISQHSSVPIYNRLTIEDCPIQVICNEQGLHIHVLFSRISLRKAFHLPLNFVQDILMPENNVF